MNTTERGIARHLGPKQLAHLQRQVIGIAGAGGLGSNCAAHLVRCGFRRFVIADFDHVAPSNLNRQFFFASQVGRLKVDALADNLLAINPDLDLTLHPVRLDSANMGTIFSRCNGIVEALDDPATKKILVETLLPCLAENALLVAASGMGGYGRADAIKTHALRKHFILIGDRKTECNAATPPFSPMVGVAAAKQADALLAHFLATHKETT